MKNVSFVLRRERYRCTSQPDPATEPIYGPIQGPINLISALLLFDRSQVINTQRSVIRPAGGGPQGLYVLTTTIP